VVLTICCVLFVFALAATTSPAREPLIIAHRGASFDAPENTLAAFQLAFEQGADGIEGDFRLSADGRVVCIHDADTKRVAGVDLKVNETTYADLRALDVGAWKGEAWSGQSIPALEDVLAIVPRQKLLFIELKAGAEIVAPLAKVLHQSAANADQIVIICFDIDVVIACKNALPKLKRHLLVDYRQQEGGAWAPSVDQVIQRIRQTDANGLGTQNRPEHVTREFVRQLRAAGVDEFHVWTVDERAAVQHFQDLGAWAITTNRPAEVRAIIEVR
jgi:glycerophosphoryl diester phosphodiesterase